MFILLALNPQSHSFSTLIPRTRTHRICTCEIHCEFYFPQSVITFFDLFLPIFPSARDFSPIRQSLAAKAFRIRDSGFVFFIFASSCHHEPNEELFLFFPTSVSLEWAQNRTKVCRKTPTAILCYFTCFLAVWSENSCLNTNLVSLLFDCLVSIQNI